MEFNTGREIVQVENLLVERDVLGIIEKIQSYDPNLVVMYLDPDKAEFCDAPWIVCERCPDGQLRRIMEVWELNETVMERIFNADSKRFDILRRIEDSDAKARAAQRRRYMEEREEMRDVFKHVLASPRVRYSFPNSDGDTVVLDDTIGIVKRNGKSC